MRRLSKPQYLNALADLTKAVLPTQGNALSNDIRALGNALPNDSRINSTGETGGGFGRLDQSLQQPHIDAIYEISLQVGRRLADSTRLGELMGACAVDGSVENDAACLTEFVRRFGRLAFRRPLSDDEVARYSRRAQGTPVQPGAVGQVIATLLMAPQFVYMTEHGQASNAAGPVPLSAHELASRLSFHFWNTAPDSTLNALADSGQLLTDNVYREQVTRLVADARVQSLLNELVTDWFRLHELEAFDGRIGTPVFDAMRGDFTPTNATRDNAIREVVDLVTYHTAQGGTLRNVLTDTRSFARTPDVAALYRVATWDGASAPPNVGDAARAGLLTRIAFTANGSANTRPIIKGYRIRKALLCQVVAPPPAAAMNVVIELSATQTTREVVEAVTEQNPACAGCHTMLNPLGFATENFDSLGRSRTSQRLFNSSAMLIGSRPVRTDAIPRVTVADARVAPDAHAVTQYIVDSGEFERCFAQHYFRYAFARGEREGDRELLTDLMNAGRSGVALKDLLARIALRPEFKSRSF